MTSRFSSRSLLLETTMFMRPSSILMILHSISRPIHSAMSPLLRIETWLAAIEPVFEPIGIDWRGSVALLTGFVAKEIVVSTMGILHAVEGPENNRAALGKALINSGMTPLSALSMMIFVLLYVPCLATVLMIMRETASIRWAFFNIVYSTLVAWCVSFVVYRTGFLFFGG